MELNNELLKTFYWQATKSNVSIYNVNNILFVIKLGAKVINYFQYTNIILIYSINGKIYG